MNEIHRCPQRQGKGAPHTTPETGTITVMFWLCTTHHSQEQGGLLLFQNTPASGGSVFPSHSQEARVSQYSFGTNILILSPTCIWKLCVISFHTSPIFKLHLKACPYPFHILLRIVLLKVPDDFLQECSGCLRCVLIDRHKGSHRVEAS